MTRQRYGETIEGRCERIQDRYPRSVSPKTPGWARDMSLEVCASFGVHEPSIMWRQVCDPWEYSKGTYYHYRERVVVSTSRTNSTKARYSMAHELAHHVRDHFDHDVTRMSNLKQHDRLFFEIVTVIYQRYHLVDFALLREYTHGLRWIREFAAAA